MLGLRRFGRVVCDYGMLRWWWWYTLGVIYAFFFGFFFVIWFSCFLFCLWGWDGVWL